MSRSIRRALLGGALSLLLVLIVGGMSLALGSTTLGVRSARTALRFNTSTLRARSGRITIVMTNASKSLAHGIAVDGRGVNARGRIVKPGRSSSVTVNLRRGRYEFFCPVKGHKAAGMRGTLIVS
ncbi:MAG: plastocyanin/azurin family copper-binding protein [Solirubrobacteraceae bacterium]